MTKAIKAIKGLKPKKVWEFFAEISAIPRCSKNEAAMTQYVLDTAERLGLAAKADRFGDVVVRKPASQGREKNSSVVLQTHLDMVCEKNRDKVHDFTKDPIEIVRKGDVLMANGTTLGADNGIGVATSLAIMSDKSLEHGPLEFLFTVDEETGLTGASNLSGDALESSLLINLDSEEEGALYVGCAGGKDTLGTWKLQFEDALPPSVVAELRISGLKGGHSGLEIDKGRGNAIKLLNRALLALASLGVRLAGMEGGNKRNAIPREAEAKVVVPAKNWDRAVACAGEHQAVFAKELASVDPDISCTLTKLKGARKRKVIRWAQQKKICRTLAGLPHGVTRMSADIPGLVETSTNVAVVNVANKSLTVATSQRSSVASEIREICQTVACIFELGGAHVEQSAGYPGWKPNMGSKILKLAKSSYKQLYGKYPEVKAIHAGLECGIIGEKYPGMDMVSFGPTLAGVHSPDEKIYISTVVKYWDLLLAILKNIR